MSITIVFLSIVFLVFLVAYLKVNPFLALLATSIIGGLFLGIPADKIASSVSKGIGDMMGSLVVVIVCGAMLGKLVAESGAAQQIASRLMKLFGEKNIKWALVVTGFIIGIPLFYNVGFVLVIPLIFSVAYQLRLPIVYTAVPMLSALSVTHGFLPPHPSPTALVAQFNANISSTLFYGILISIPTVIIAGPLFANTLKNIKATGIIEPQEFQVREGRTPGLFTCIFTSILPVLLLAITTIALPYLQEGVFKDIVLFFSDSTMVMLISLITATFTLGLLQGRTIKKVMDIYADAVKDIAMMLLIISGAGALKQILIDSGVSNEIAVAAAGINIHPLILGWIIAASIRVCVGSSTVAGLTAAGIIAPLVIKTGVNANLMVLSVGAGSLLFSHVNDTGFWLFKEYLNLSIKDTIRSWSLMETIISVCGLVGVLVLQYFT